MKKGDYVFVVKPEVLTGDKRPSLATIVLKDDDRVLVESTYYLPNALPNHSHHARWIVPVSSCIPVDISDIQNARIAKHSESKLSKGDLVAWVTEENHVCEGVIINVTPKTVEILGNGTSTIRRKKKDLVIKV
tara:strand:- start:608 stop:1006 length:399 start_codon:yes stop_codon:yes gene_type:complete